MQPVDIEYQHRLVLPCADKQPSIVNGDALHEELIRDIPLQHDVTEGVHHPDAGVAIQTAALVQFIVVEHQSLSEARLVVGYLTHWPYANVSHHSSSFIYIFITSFLKRSFEILDGRAVTSHHKTT